MKIRSLIREKKQTEISLSIIKEMNKLSLKNNSKFVLLFLEDFNDDRSKKYDLFLKNNNINHIKCLMPKGQKYIVQGDGHPNGLSHYVIGKCIDKKIKINSLIQ
tara:strand:- start:218 stop:529 length:312 start_codon:yes stop_codon:yes gene_type:complete